MKKINKWNSSVIISKRGFRCSYCDKQRIGAYRWVDGVRSCEKCNREYEPPPREKIKIYSIKCPLCKGKGNLTND